MTLLLKAKWSSVCLPLQDLFCNCIASLGNIETGRNVSLGVLLLIWLPGSSIGVQNDKSKHYSQCNGCFSNTLANEALWFKVSHLIIVKHENIFCSPNNLLHRYRTCTHLFTQCVFSFTFLFLSRVLLLIVNASARKNWSQLLFTYLCLCYSKASWHLLRYELRY